MHGLKFRLCLLCKPVCGTSSTAEKFARSKNPEKAFQRLLQPPAPVRHSQNCCMTIVYQGQIYRFSAFPAALALPHLGFDEPLSTRKVYQKWQSPSVLHNPEAQKYDLINFL